MRGREVHGIGRRRLAVTFPGVVLALAFAAPAAATAPPLPPVPTTLPALPPLPTVPPVAPPVEVPLSGPSLPPLTLPPVSRPGPEPATATTAASTTTAAPAPSTPRPAPADARTRPVVPGRAAVAGRPAGGPPPTAVPAAQRLRMDRLEQAAAVAAREFSFPLGLALAVALFLVVQGRLDARDPKLARAPVSEDDDLVAFR